MKTKILICGAGKMGNVHLNSLLTIDPDLKNHEIAIIDHNPERLAKTPDYTTKFKSTEEATIFEPELIVMAYNDNQHYNAYATLLELPSLKGVIGEKPFCQTVEDAQKLERYFTGKNPLFLSIHTVINYSPIFNIVAKDTADTLKNYDISGADLAWGKDRTQDTRPTPGIISDMTHPLSVLHGVLKLSNLKWQSGNGKKGYLSPKAEDVVWGFDQHRLTSDQGDITLNASYGWAEQARRITVFFKHAASRKTATLEYNFDLRDENNNNAPYDIATLSYTGEDGEKITKRFSTQNGPNQDKALNFMRTNLEGYENHKTNQPAPQGITNFQQTMEQHALMDDTLKGIIITQENVDPEDLTKPAEAPSEPPTASL